MSSSSCGKFREGEETKCWDGETAATLFSDVNVTTLLTSLQQYIIVQCVQSDSLAAWVRVQY